MLTVYYVRIAQSLPLQTISHTLPAVQAVSADHTHTHPTQATLTNRHRTQSVYTSTNESMRAIDSGVYEVIR